jgi:hypothetical protein
MDALVVKIGVNTWTIFGSAEELIQLVNTLSLSSFRVEAGFEAGLIILAKNYGKRDFLFSEIKHIILREMLLVNKSLNDSDTQAWIDWSCKGFESIDFDQEIEAWAERLPK